MPKMKKNVVLIEGEDAAPEAVRRVVALMDQPGSVIEAIREVVVAARELAP